MGKAYELSFVRFLLEKLNYCGGLFLHLRLFQVRFEEQNDRLKAVEYCVEYDAWQ